MSADLLAEFDSFYQSPQDGKQPTSTTPAANDLSFLGTTGQSTQFGTGQGAWQAPVSRQNEDIWGNMTAFQPSNSLQPAKKQDDIWGFFEAAEETKPPAQAYAAPIPNYGGTSAVPSRNDRSTIVRRDTLQMFSSNIDSWEPPTASKPNTIPARAPPMKPPAPTRIGSSGGDILFDADELSEEEDDDFGDFEAAPADPLPTQSQPPNSQSLQGLFGAISITPNSSKRPTELLPTPPVADSPYPQAPKSPSFQERNPFANLGVSTNQVSKIKNETREASPVTPWPNFEPPKPKPYQDSPVPGNDLDDDWGEFADMPPEPESTTTKNLPGIEADAWAWDEADRVSESKHAPEAIEIPPPTNIPPPSLLIPIFSSLFDLPQSALFKPVANQSFSLKNRILSNPSTIEFLRGYLLIATVAAHIIAGRKFRWKRDSLLSQAMKIGPSAPGGKGGMKLAGVDKAETTREDREAADLVRVWKDQLGRLKSAVAVANTSIQKVNDHLAIPEIGESMQVKTQEGGLTAPKQCVICGLKRDERVSKVDINVEDSFGEWWTEHWGHRACKNFWLEHESKLKHR